MLNDDDKKYLKDNIENPLHNLDKQVQDLAKSSSASPKRPQPKKKETIEDRLTALEEAERKGEATIAQKIELMNLSLKTAIPEDFKQTMKETGATMKKGMKQVGQGLDQAIAPIMMSNPLTAMLYQSKDVIAALTGGTLKVGAGAIKGAFGVGKAVASGAAGLLSNAINMFKKKPQADSQADDVPEKEETGSFIPRGKDEEENTDDTELSTAKKIDEIWKATVKDSLKQKAEEDKKEKTRNNILSQGLNGLGKSMKAVNAVVETIMAKQKLILGGLMMGSIAVLALVGWFKEGGLQKAIKGLLKDDKSDGSSSPQADNDRSALDNFVHTQDAVAMNNDQVGDLIKQSTGGNYSKLSGPTKVNFNNVKDLVTKGHITEKDADEIINGRTNDTDKQFRQANNTERLSLSFPFKIKISKVVGSPTKDSNYISLDIERIKTLKNPHIRITKVVKQIWPTGEEVPESTPFAIVDKNFGIIGNWDEFVGAQEEDTNKEWKADKNKAAENYKKNRTDEIKDKQVTGAIKTANELYNAQFKHNDGFINNLKDKWGTELVDGKPTFDKETISGQKSYKPGENKPNASTTQVKSPQTPKSDLAGEKKVETPPSNMNNSNNTDTKVAEQKTALKEAEKAVQAERVQPTQQAQPSTPTTINVQSKGTSNIPRTATNMDTTQFNAMNEPN